MDSYAPPIGKPRRVDLSSLIGLYPDEPIKNIAVLFTDLVGSTRFFKTHGDPAGRAMLQEHYEIAAPVINEYGGKLIKALGDSVMAYFISPAEALKSAIRMQQRFNTRNNKDDKDQMPVRIGIHCGRVIIEEKDIYGDVVNVAAKLTNMAEGGEIYVSREVFELINDIPFVSFEFINTWEKRNIPKGLTVYKVVWDATVELEPAIDTVLYLRPLWKLSEDGFQNVWNSMIEARDSLWGEKTKKEESLPDKSLLLTMRESAFALAVAGSVIDFFKDKLLQENEGAFLPVQAVIDVNLHFPEGQPGSHRTVHNWDDFDPGIIHIASGAYDIIKRYIDIPGQPAREKLTDGFFHKVLPAGNRQMGAPSLAAYRKKLVEGTLPPCYYCGGRKHRPVDCPSKGLPEITHALDKLGYLPLDGICRLFFQYLLSDASGLEITSQNPDKDLGKSPITAHYGFFELKRIFQLRFFRTVWDNMAEEWNKLREGGSHGDGGLVWLAQDSLRVSDLDRAEAILRRAMEDNQEDYRIYCALGYLNIERDDPLHAERCLEKALVRARSNPQKVFVLLLLFRLYMLSSDYGNARRRIKEILVLNPTCVDAVYHSILLDFSEGNEKGATRKLAKLIRDNRTYFVYALIDPDLSPWGAAINHELLALFNAAKDSADVIFHEAENKVEKSKKTLDARGMGEVQSLLLKSRNMLGSDSYFSYLDIIYYGNSIISICENSMKEQKKALSERLHQLDSRIENDKNFIKNYHYPRFIASCGKRLAYAGDDIRRIQDAIKATSGEDIRTIEEFCDAVLADLAHTEISLKKFDILGQFLFNFSLFAKKSFILLAIVLFIGIIGLPLVAPHFDAAFPAAESSASSIWFYQKTFLIAGGAASIGISLFITIRNIMKNG